MKTIRIRRPADPLQSEIDMRYAAKKARSERKHVPAPVVGTAALHDGAGLLWSICSAAMALASVCVGIVRER